MRRPGILLTALIAWTGVVLGHLAAYLLTYPNQGIRHVHLAVTGHSWLGLATASLLGAIPVVVLVAAIRGVRSESPWLGSALALRLAAIQIPAFALLETLERQWSFGQTFSDPAVFVGLALQPLLAVLAAWILDLVRRAARAIALLLLPAPRPAPRAIPRPKVQPSVPRLWLFLGVRRRAPPAVSSV